MASIQINPAVYILKANTDNALADIPIVQETSRITLL